MREKADWRGCATDKGRDLQNYDFLETYSEKCDNFPHDSSEQLLRIVSGNQEEITQEKILSAAVV